jgi:hypothetical protein
MGCSVRHAIVLGFLVLEPALMAQTPRRPRGIYAKVNIASEIDQQQKANPSSYVDDAFNQVSTWNVQNPAQPQKTIQLIVTPGFQTPQWVLDQIPSCNGLFQSPAQTPPGTCGKATFAGYSEVTDGTEFPLPWNPFYKSAWKTFLTALAAQYGSNPAFVSIAVGGPTAASEEMILPNNNNTPSQSQFGGILPNAMWLQLLSRFMKY